MRKRRTQPLEGRILETINKYRMTSRGEKVLIAVSGGADSMALLHALHRLAPVLGITLSVAHLNHQLRGEDSDRDEAFVAEACRNLAIPCLSEKMDVAARAAENKRNLEDAAREIRYEFLRRAAGRAGARKIAVGHTINDQAETVLLRFLRGSGVRGLSGIHPVVDGEVIRPLIECSRAGILRYLESIGAGFRLDSSNSEVRFRRNRVRLELIPFLERHFNPNLTATLAREAGLARETADYIDCQAQAAYDSIRARTPEGLVLNAARLLEMHPAVQRAAVRLAILERRGNLRGIASGHVQGILSLCRSLRSGRRIELPGGTVVSRQFEAVLFSHPETLGAGASGFSYSLAVPGHCRVPEAGMEFSAEAAESVPETAGGGVPGRREHVILDASALPDVLTVRSRLPGDRYGGPRHRKVKKMLIDARIPLVRRASLPMIAAGETVIWVPGFKPARPYAPVDPRQKCIIITCRKV